MLVAEVVNVVEESVTAANNLMILFFIFSLQKFSTQKASTSLVINLDPDIVVIDALFNRVLIGSITGSSTSVVSQKVTRINDRHCSSEWHLSYHSTVQARLSAKVCEVLDVFDN